MGTINHPLFGEIDPEEEECWEATIEHNGREVEVDLNIEEKDVDPEAITQTISCLDKLIELEARAREEFRKDHDSGREFGVSGYIQHHNEELNLNLNIDSLLDKCELTRVGLYPGEEEEEDDSESEVVLDFRIAEVPTQYLLVVKFDRQGQFISLGMES